MPSCHTGNYTSLLENEDLASLSDCQLKCGEKTWKLHKSIICIHSPFFLKALTGNFQEAKTGVVELDADQFSVDHVDCVIKAMYSQSLGHIGGLVASALGSEILETYDFCFRVWEVANFLGVEPLCASILRSLHNLNHTLVLQLRSNYNKKPDYPGAKFIDYLFNIAHMAYEDLPGAPSINGSRGGPRGVVIDLFSRAGYILTNNATVLQRMADFPDLACQVLRLSNMEKCTMGKSMWGGARSEKGSGSSPYLDYW
ncbi:hypothetical protein OQA88_11766 [Cercophora sp. LCS_1]